MDFYLLGMIGAYFIIVDKMKPYQLSLEQIVLLVTWPVPIGVIFFEWASSLLFKNGER